jgi:hypothetical protein
MYDHIPLFSLKNMISHFWSETPFVAYRPRADQVGSLGICPESYRTMRSIQVLPINRYNASTAR